MFITFFFFYSLVYKADSDTIPLYLPIKNGKTVDLNTDARKHSSSILITPTSDFSVRSCSSGKVVQIKKTENYGFGVMIMSNGVFYNYTMLN